MGLYAHSDTRPLSIAVNVISHQNIEDVVNISENQA